MPRSRKVTAPQKGPGPYQVRYLLPKTRYELSNGYAIFREPTGGDGARGTLIGAEVLDTDPAVKEAGIDVGYSRGPRDLRAPDVAVGNVPNQPGWIEGAPPLAVEYAGSGQDEAKLAEKIDDLLRAGTRWIWVVRLVGSPRVEVHTKNAPVRTFRPGSELTAEGVLKNPVPVEALFDRSTAHRLTLRNLLQREGYNGLDAVREEGREEGRAAAILAVLGARGVEVPAAARARILACRDRALIDAWLSRAATAERLADVLG